MTENINSFPKKNSEKEKNPEEEMSREEVSKNTSFESLSLAELQETLRNVEDSDEYKEYHTQRVTLETLDRLPDEVATLFTDPSSEDIKNIQAAKDALVVYIENVKQSVNNYYGIIERLSISAPLWKFKLSDDEFVKKMKERDSARTSAHEVLIGNLKALTRFCVNQNKDLKVKTLFSMTRKAFPHTRLFSSFELNDRNYVGDWAFRVVQGEKFEEMHRIIDREIANRKAVG